MGEDAPYGQDHLICFVFVKNKTILSNNTNIIIKNEVTLISCDCNILLFRLGSNGCANNY